MCECIPTKRAWARLVPNQVARRPDAVLAGSFYCGFAGGPFLFPGAPLIFAGSCCRIVGSSCLVAALEPTVPELTDGPLLPPGLPGIPAPEFWALGAVSGLADWAMAAGTAIASASEATLTNHFIVSSSVAGN